MAKSSSISDRNDNVWNLNMFNFKKRLQEAKEQKPAPLSTPQREVFRAPICKKCDCVLEPGDLFNEEICMICKRGISEAV